MSITSRCAVTVVVIVMSPELNLVHIGIIYIYIKDTGVPENYVF